jgi:hypothetical protein
MGKTTRKFGREVVLNFFQGVFLYIDLHRSLSEREANGRLVSVFVILRRVQLDFISLLKFSKRT